MCIIVYRTYSKIRQNKLHFCLLSINPFILLLTLLPISNKDLWHFTGIKVLIISMCGGYKTSQFKCEVERIMSICNQSNIQSLSWKRLITKCVQVSTNYRVRKRLFDFFANICKTIYKEKKRNLEIICSFPKNKAIGSCQTNLGIIIVSILILHMSY